MTSIEIRPAVTDDLEAMHRINQAAVPAVGPVTSDELRALFKMAMVALVAVDGDKVGGFCLVLAPGTAYRSANYAWFAERYDDFVYLDRVAIAPWMQRRGIGRRFYDEVERLVTERRPSATVLGLEVNLRPRNDASLAFHDRLGFVEVGVRSPSETYSVSMLTKTLAAPTSSLHS